MADPQNSNPFSTYSLDEQNQYADQLRGAMASGKLNPAQTQGVQNALKYLPMSIAAADQNLSNLATKGQGTWQPTPAPSFNSISPEMMAFGRKGAAVNPIPSPHATPEYGEPGLLKRPDEFHPGNLRDIGGLEVRKRTELGVATGQVNDRVTSWAGEKGAQIGSAALVGSPTTMGPMPDTPEIRGIGAGVGRTIGSMGADPTTYGTFLLGGLPKVGQLAVGAAFAGQMGTATVQQGKKVVSEWNDPNISPQQRSEDITSTVLSGAMTGFAAKHTVGELKPSYRTPEPAPTASAPTSSPSRVTLGPGAEGLIGTTRSINIDGKSVGNITYEVSGDTATVHHFGGPEADYNRLSNQLGRSGLRDIAKQIQEAHPEVQNVQGIRVGGARGEDARSVKIPLNKPAVPGEDAVSEATRTVGDAREPLKVEPDIATSASRDEFLTQAKARTETPQPDTGSKWKSVQQQLEAGETPKGAGSPPLQRPASKTPISDTVDLRTLSSEDRHAWPSKNAIIQGKTAEGVAQDYQKLFGRAPERINPYIDKEGITRYGAQYSQENKTSLPSQSETASAKKPPTSTQAPGAPAYVGNPETQALEQKLLKSGAGQQMLDTLQKAAKDSAPDGTPPESIQKVYHRSLDALSRGMDTGDSKLMRKAFDIANRRLEAGKFTPAGRPAMSATQSRVFEEFHVTKMLDKWEGFSDEQLKSRDVRKKLTSDEFSNSVAATSNPALEMRHNALLERVGHLGADPISALGRLFGGQQLSAGDISRGVLRESLATAARSKDMNAHALDTYIQQWNSRPVHETLGFIDSIETGNIGSIADPQDRMVAQRLRDMLDTKRDQINGLGTGKFDTFIENYFPHLWKFGVTDIARQTLQGRRPLAGGAGFLKPRTYTSFTEGIANGLEPVTYNPVQMALLKLHEMDRYLAAHTAFEELKTRGLAASFIPKDVPDGWVKLNDQMFRAGEQSYYAPSDAARPINNHLSPGLRGNALFNSVTAYNNILNQFNLGFSVFHGTETAINSIASEMGLGLQKISRGDLKGVGNVLSSPAAPLRNYLLGSKVIAEYLDPGRYSQLSSQVDALQRAGGRIAMPPEFKNAAVEAWSNAFKEYNSAKGFQNIPAFGKMQVRKLGAIMEALSAPLMEKFVPRIKLGTFAREAQDILDRLPPNTPKEIMRAELGKAWDSVDNRFGQVVYDNLFWNRTAKDIAHIAIRSVGWNLGTIREIGGGVFNVRDLQQPLSGKGFTTKQAYVLALGTMTLGMGAVINAAYGQKPQSLTDYIYPKTGKIGVDGEPERIMLKTYIHDSLAFGHAPGQTAVNKLSPAWNQLANLYSNSDYYGTRIHPIHSSTSAALADPQTYTSTASYLAKSALPFSLENFNQRRLSGESVLSSLSSSAAILPAPKWAGQSPAASMAYEFYKTKLSRGPNDPDVVARLQRYHQLATGYAANQFTVADITKAYRAKEITTKQFDGILDESDGKLTPLQRHSKQLSPQELLQVWHLSSPEERQSLQEMFLHKWDTITDDPELSNKFNSAWKASHTH